METARSGREEGDHPLDGESGRGITTISDDQHLVRGHGMMNRPTGTRAQIEALIALVVLVAGIASCKPKTNAYAPPPPAEVTVAHPVRKPVTRYLEYTGTTEPYEAVELRARVAGFLDQVNFKPGASVKKGDLLFQIDPRVYEAQVQ